MFKSFDEEVKAMRAASAERFAKSCAEMDERHAKNVAALNSTFEATRAKNREEFEAWGRQVDKEFAEKQANWELTSTDVNERPAVNFAVVSNPTVNNNLLHQQQVQQTIQQNLLNDQINHQVIMHHHTF